MKKINVKNSGIVQLKTIGDQPDGSLHIYDAQNDQRIDIKRFYIIADLMNREAVRGKHAHKKLEQFIFCVHGSFTLGLDDGIDTQKITLDSPSTGIRLGAKLWHTMENFSKDCVILVVANDQYDESDYMRDYNTFLEYVKKS